MFFAAQESLDTMYLVHVNINTFFNRYMLVFILWGLKAAGHQH